MYDLVMQKRWMLLAFFLMGMCGVVLAQAPPKGHHVVFVISSADKDDWRSGMILADHFLAGVKPERSEIEVLAYGGGIDVLTKTSSEAEYIAKLEGMGVHFVACETAMRAHKIGAQDLLPGVTSVPSGVIELVRKQETGWSYVKVGR